jgi:hypothetical protein
MDEDMHAGQHHRHHVRANLVRGLEVGALAPVPARVDGR